MRRRISFIGVGNMASAILSGITARKIDPVIWTDIVLFNKHPEKIRKYAEMGAFIASDLKEAVELSDCVMLCVKPQTFPEILHEISLISGIENKLFVSIAAGVTTKKISEYVNGAPIVRVMPNTPMLIGQGVSAICRTSNVSDDDLNFVSNIFSSAGNIIAINEDEMNRIICVSGSSPAYVFMFIKAMIDGAIRQGLLREEGSSDGLSEKELVDTICDTIIGSASLLKYGDKTPNEQIQTVCSKGGTTERAVAELERHGFCEAVISAMQKCTDRAEELSKE